MRKAGNMNALKEFEKWNESPFVDPQTKAELANISSDEKEIEERFYKNLEFGTAGLRGIIGAGTNRMNIYTVRKAAQGLAMFISQRGEEEKNRGVAISYDSRHYSDVFALECAKVLAKSGIKSYLFDELKPVPMLSFSVRHLNCIAGIMITASHNPAKYNGLKVYWEDGAQCPPAFADKIFEFIEKTDIFEGIGIMDEIEAKSNGLINMIGKDVENAYLEKVYEQSLNKDEVEKANDNLKIVYTPFHGAGNKPVRKILNMIGAKNVFTVPEQEEPDPDFSTVKSPNPENPEGFVYAKELAEKVGSDLIIGTDPDCDRMGIMVRNKNGEFVPFTGNQVGALLMDYIAMSRTENKTMPKDPVAVKTIVSTPMAQKICDVYGIEMRNVLTGFKYIGEIIKELEDKGEEERFIFGFEESYGCLAGTYARDKDAVVASMLITEMAAYYKNRNMTVYEAMEELYKKYGFYKELQVSLTREGMEGVKKIKSMVNYLEENPIETVDSEKVAEISNYRTGEKTDTLTGKSEKIDLPKSDVLEYVLEDSRKFIIRPSGTEPKIKFYFFAKGDSEAEAEKMISSLKESVLEFAEKLL